MVTITDALPVALTAGEISGEGWDCDLSTLTCTRSDALPAGAFYPAVTLIATLTVPGEVVNTASVSGGADAYLDNNTDFDLSGEWIEVYIPVVQR